MNRRAFLSAVTGSLLAAPIVAETQQASRVWRIGFLGATSPSGYASLVEALRQGLRDHDYVEGKNLIIEYRWAEGKYDRLPNLAAELVRQKVDLIVTHGTPGTLAAKQATKTIPIVMALTGDAVANGLVTSNARPGGNITGTSFFFPELNAKRLELLKEALPRARRIAALANPDNPATAGALKAMEQMAGSLTADFHVVDVRGPDEFPRAFSEMVRKRVEGVVVLDDGMLIGNAGKVADLTTKNRLPAIGFQEYVDAGGLMAYGANFPKLWRRAGSFVDKILKGTRPADLPVEQASNFDLIVNLKTARALGLVIPPSLLGRADQVIE